MENSGDQGFLYDFLFGILTLSLQSVSFQKQSSKFLVETVN